MASLFLRRQSKKTRCFFLFQITEEKHAVLCKLTSKVLEGFYCPKRVLSALAVDIYMFYVHYHLNTQVQYAFQNNAHQRTISCPLWRVCEDNEINPLAIVVLQQVLVHFLSY